MEALNTKTQGTRPEWAGRRHDFIENKTEKQSRKKELNPSLKELKKDKNTLMN